MPLALRLFKRLVAADRTLTACASDGKLHRKHRYSHYQKEQQIEEHEHSAAVLTGNVGELPDVSDADSASRAYQDKSQPRFKIFSCHVFSFYSYFLFIIAFVVVQRFAMTIRSFTMK